MAGMVGAGVDELLRREENRGLLVGLEEASRRVEKAREALADVERQEAEALRAKELVRQLESRQSQIAESQKELLEARAMVEDAQRTLSPDIVESISGDSTSQGNDKDRERLESIKSAAVSSIAGALASLPISLYQTTSFSQLTLQSAIILVSCALFGVTFRYAVRRDIDNVQLKTGTAAAFGLTKGLAALEAGKPLELDTDALVSISVAGTVNVAESVFIFLAAAIALDFCFKMRILSPFPMKK